MWNKSEERNKQTVPMHKSITVEKAGTSTMEAKEAAENSGF